MVSLTEIEISRGRPRYGWEISLHFGPGLQTVKM
jgi:hypothetical protein